MKRRIALLLFASGVLSALLPNQTRNPYTSPEDVAAGGRIYRSHCAECHGLDGSGGRGAGLTQGKFRHGGSDAALFNTISKGIPGTEMPGTFFQGKQVWQIVAFVQSLSERATPATAGGDPAKGKALFTGKGGCAQCHRIDGQGGRGGPDLSDIGATRSIEHLRSSILRPNENVPPRYWTVRAVTKDGKSIAGRRLNEDTFSLQILDANENLVSLLKSDLAKYRIDKTSPMPPYQEMLGEAEARDLTAYLATLRKDRRSP